MNTVQDFYQNYKTGDIIIKEGETSYGCFILVSGKVGVYKELVKVTEIDKQGVIFGEISLILDSLRTATVMALEDTVVYYIKTDLDTLITKYPSVVNKIMYNLAEELERTTNDLFTTMKLLNYNKLNGDT